MVSNELRARNAQIVETILNNARAGNLDVIEGYFAEDFVLHNAPGLPYGGDYFGWSGYVEQCDKLNSFWANAIHHEREFIAVGDDRVFVHFWIDRDIAHNGQRVKMPIVAIWELKEGKVTRIRPFYFDTKRIADLAAM
jgi:ketosteroid isomerase-like protein